MEMPGIASGAGLLGLDFELLHALKSCLRLECMELKVIQVA